MNRWRGYTRAAVALAAAASWSAWVSTDAGAQSRGPSRTPSRPAARTPAASYGAGVVATVGSEKITRDRVFDEMLATQLTRLGATNPLFNDMGNLSAAQFDVVIAAGRLALSRAGKPNAAPVTRLEVMRDVFSRKPTILVQTVENMIRERALAQAAAAAGIKITPAQVKQRATQFIDASWRQPYRLTGRTDDQIVRSLGVSRPTLDRYISFLLTVEALAAREVQRKMGHAPGPGDYVEVSRLAVAVIPASASVGTPENPGGPQNAQAAMDEAFDREKPRILAAVEEIKTGKKTFEQVAGEINSDETKFRQGAVGVVLRGQLEPEVDKVIFSLPKGELSEPVRTRGAWHVYRVNKVGVELTGPERAAALQRVVEGLRARIVTETVARAKVTNTMPPPPARVEEPHP